MVYSGNHGSVKFGKVSALSECVSFLIKHWKFIMLSFIVSFMVLFFYFKNKQPVYRAKVSILLQDDKTSEMVSLDIWNDFGLDCIESSIGNELAMLQSKGLMESVVRKMGLEVTYYESDFFQTKEIYGEECPYTVHVSNVLLERLPVDGFTFYVDLKNEGKIGLASSEVDPATVLPFVSLTLKKSIPILERNRQYSFKITNPIVVAASISGNLELERRSKHSYAIYLKLKSGHPLKGEKILRTLIEEYNQRDLKEQSSDVNETRRSIDDRLAVLSKEISDIEKQIESYKSRNRLVDWDSEVTLYTEQTKMAEDKLLEVCSQLACIQNIQNECVNKMSEGRFLPLLMKSDKQSINVLISKYNHLSMVLNQLKKTAGAGNLSLMESERRLSYQKEIIQKSLASEKERLVIQKRSLTKQQFFYKHKIADLPLQERILRSLVRQREIKSNLFLSLLKKKEEMPLSFIFYKPKAKLIEDTQSDSAPISPGVPFILTLAFFTVIIILALFHFLYKKYDFRIESKAELESVTSAPVLGEIPKAEESGNIVLHESSTNTLIEMFRLFRGNLLFFMGNEPDKVILVTSFQGGEGKTFTSINLGLSLAFLNKKVLLIGLDLRKPKLSEYLGREEKEGLTSYLSGFELKRPLIRNTGIHQNLDYIPAGAIPPNPNELLSNTKLDELIADMRKKYDYLILDTAPVGIVSDSFQLDRFADVTLFVVRSKYTHKQCVKDADAFFAEGKLTNLCYLLNDGQNVNGSYALGYGMKKAYGAY